VAVGPVNLPVTRLFVEEIILECRQKRITRVDILGFEFEMGLFPGLFPNILDEAKAKGIDLAMKYIPRDVFDKRAVEKNQVVFHDVSFIEIKPHFKKNSIAMELTDFSVFYSQDAKGADESLKKRKSKVIVDKGQVVKISKDKNGIRSLEFKSVFRECPPGRRKIAVKVVDIFGNDTMKIVEVTVGGKRQ